MPPVIAAPAERRAPARACRVALGAALAAAALLCSTLVAAQNADQDADQDAAEVEAQLAEMRERIEAISEAIDRDRAARDREMDALATAERALGEITRQLRATRQDLAETRAEIDALDTRMAALRNDVQARRERLAQQLRAAYRLGGQARLRSLLSAEDPGRMARLMAWHGYLARARVQSLESLRTDLDALAEMEAELTRQRDRQEQLLARQDADRERHAEARTRRQEAVAALDERIRDREDRRAELERSAAELESLLEQLSDALADIPPDAEAPRFADLRGNLPSPLDGPRRAAFGQRRDGGTTWSGWLIDADPGTEVQAVAHGRVAYADWLRGYGLMLIIDHGDGFMTLYGHNESLLAEVGDWIRPGETIALAGTSGGETDTGLYFEIRKDGQPVDPAAWVGDG